MKPLVSIIVPIYNTELYLAECLDSLVGQTYDNIEIILINDGSTDDSYEIAKKYAAEYENIRLFSGENQGVNYAREKGVHLSSGEYIMFVDSDDYISINAVELLLENLLMNNIDFSMSNVSRFNKKKTAIRDFGKSERIIHKTIDDALGFMLNSYIFLAGKLFKRSLLENVEFPKYKICEDYLTVILLFKNIKSMGFVNIPLYHYRQRKTSVTHKAYGDYFKTAVEISERAVDIIEELSPSSVKFAWLIYFDEVFQAVSAIIAGDDKKSHVNALSYYDKRIREIKRLIMDSDEKKRKIKLRLYLISKNLYKIVLKIYRIFLTEHSNLYE